MAETSPLINLDLVNQIYKVINAQIAERVYDPQYYTSATLGTSTYKYVSAFISGNTSTGTLNNLTLTPATAGFTISGGSTSKTLKVADTATINSSLTVSAATNIIKSLTVGAAATYTGAVTIRSGGTGSTTIVGPDGKTANLINGDYTTSATTSNSDTPTAGYLLKIGTVDAKKFLAGPISSSGTADYRTIVASDLPVASVSADGIVTTGDQAFEGVKTFKEPINGDTTGNAATASKLKTARSLKITDGTNTSTGVNFDGSDGVSINLPSTIKATFSGNLTGDVTGNVSGSSGSCTGNAATATKATNDSADQQINTTYIKGLSVDGRTITCTKGDGSTNTITTQDTTYTFDPGDNNGQIKVTSSSGDAYNVSVKGLGSRAYDSTDYLALAGGTVTGVTSFSNTTDSTNNTSGAVIVSGGLGVAKNIYAAAVHNAVWNDLVDCMEVPEDTSLEFGYCYSWKGDSVIKSSRSSKNCIGIHSNTAGFVMGEKKTKTIQAAVAGFVLAYVDKLYPEGTPLTWGDNGTLTKCSLLKRVLHPERIIATFYKEEKEEKWHNLPVSGRHWVRVV